MKHRIVELLSSAANWLVLSHEKPDGDTIGSAVGLANVGKRLSKRVILGCPDPYPEKYSFLYDGLELRVLDCIPPDFPLEDSLIVCLDTSKIERSVPGLEKELPRHTIVNIDHHIDNEMYGALNLLEADASSTGEIVAELLSSSPWGIEKREADALYVAMVTDNGRFSFASTSVKSHMCAIMLLKAGVSPSEITEKLNANLTSNTLRLWGRAFSKAEVFCGGLAAIMWLADSDFDATGTTREDTENLVNYLLRIKGVRLCTLGTEVEGGTRFSVRARAPYNARVIASHFGGGGHDLAAGCTIHEPIGSALAMMKREMEERIEAGISDSR
ncbi:bifunctional oligoribonuclease/PAP phosphatase NrnA [Synergistaceae bacterium OttesenSCG-928-I11]|nr:bifunctional oligoribonuclease/PAP phosphatase NrnA [Synergistaceae bacterium OttesenSCG-928-I11]